MKLCVVGTGYVGLVVGACLSDFGHHVTCVDNNPDKVALLRRGGVPIFEPGLEEVVERNRERGRLEFTTDLTGAVGGAEVHFIAVGTPASEDGSADLSGVFAVARSIAEALQGHGTIVIKSTVPVGTAARVRNIVTEHTTHSFDVVSNPEFLAEGTAVSDFTRPDRIVVGYSLEGSGPIMDRLYAPLVRTGRPIHHMSNSSAEMSKYAANAMLATRITFMNELANLCERVGADVDAVRRVVGGDTRIGPRFLFPGCGYGGSCFPKDVQALAYTADQAEHPLQLVGLVHEVNEQQKRVLGAKLRARWGEDWSGRTIALWGLAFKPRTDDIREAPSLVFIAEAVERGARVVAFDPEAMEETRRELGDAIDYASGPMQAAEGADALVIPTDWNAFRSPDFAELLEKMAGRVVVDGRNLYDPREMAALGFDYQCIGRPHYEPAR